MSFKVSCPHCKKILRITEPAFGKILPCPGCNQPINVRTRPRCLPVRPWNALRWGLVGSSLPADSSPAQLPSSMPAMPNDATPDDPLAFLHSEPGASASPADRWSSEADGSAEPGSAPPPDQLPPSMPSLPDMECRRVRHSIPHFRKERRRVSSISSISDSNVI